MSRIPYIKTTFTSGEVSADLLGRGDLKAYDNGAQKLRNVFIQPTGGLTRRAGLRHIDTALGKGRLIAFEFNTEQTYLLVLTHYKLSIYLDGSLITRIDTAWPEADIDQVSWTQSADTLLMTHPNFKPIRLIRQAAGTWQFLGWEFYIKNNIVYQPMYKFAEAAVTLHPSATTGTITLTASAPVFQAGHVLTRFRIGNKEVRIDAVTSPTVATAFVVETLLSTAATVDWEEAAFSDVRGYPITAAFHQDRLVIGGSRDLPNRMWFSQTGDLFNFDLGTGLDSEAIEFGIFSDQINAIRAVFSGRHLQVFTSGAEWMVTGDPLTPSSVQIKRQTRVGSMTERYIPPIDVDGATLFVARNGQELREFIFTSVEDAYQATDLALLSHHIITTPVDQDYDQRRRLLFLVRADGKFATLTVYRAEEVAAWTLHETAGNVVSVSVVGESVYLLIRYGSQYYIEQLEEGLYLDSALHGASATLASTWTGLSHLNGKYVTVVADGRIETEKLVSGGALTLAQPAREVEIGIPYTHLIEPLPPANISEIGYSRAVRLVEASFRLQNTSALTLDVGRGLKDISLRDLREDGSSGEEPYPVVSGDIRVRAYGWKNDTSKPLWRIEQDMPLPFSLLAVQAEIIANS